MTKDKPLVSIVTSSFNQATFLSQTMQSVFNQSYPRIEYIVTDAGSTVHYVASAVAPVASTWYHFRISCSAAGTIKLQVASANGSLGTAVSSNTDVPTGVNLQVCTQIFPRSNAAVTTIIDRTSYVAATQRI